MTTEPIGLSGDLATGQVMRTMAGNHDIAVWRSASGVISAWENRCPHRGMRLSHGFVRGETLACAYHGWHFSCEGFCHYIPAHPELNPPKTVRPTIYSIVELSGLIWVDPIAEAQPVKLPEDTIPVRSLAVRGEATVVEKSLSTVPCNLTETVLALQTLSDTPRVLAAKVSGIENALVIALQQRQPDTVVVHVLVRDGVSAPERIVISRWLDSVQRQAESKVGNIP